MKSIVATLAIVLAFFASTAFAAVNVNTATVEELAALDGIGQVKAQAIVDYRKAHDGFENIEELDEVDGIGDATLENIRDDVTLGEQK